MLDYTLARRVCHAPDAYALKDFLRAFGFIPNPLYPITVIGHYVSLDNEYLALVDPGAPRRPKTVMLQRHNGKRLLCRVDLAHATDVAIFLDTLQTEGYAPVVAYQRLRKLSLLT